MCILLVVVSIHDFLALCGRLWLFLSSFFCVYSWLVGIFYLHVIILSILYHFVVIVHLLTELFAFQTTNANTLLTHTWACAW